MKNLILIFVMTAQVMFAQQIVQTPQINVSGEGKVLVTPDEAWISVSVETTNKEAKFAKKENDEITDSVLRLIKQKGIPISDFSTQNVSLYKNYDYNSKKYTYVASQTILIKLRDLSKYDLLMMDLVETGINGITNVEFKSSKILEFEKEARKKAMLNAKQKALDYVSVLEGQKVGKAIQISDNSYTSYPPMPVFANTKAMLTEADREGSQMNETLAIGQIEIICNVTVSFTLE